MSLVIVISSMTVLFVLIGLRFLGLDRNFVSMQAKKRKWHQKWLISRTALHFLISDAVQTILLCAQENK